jgi:hypothetical protein
MNSVTWQNNPHFIHFVTKKWFLNIENAYDHQIKTRQMCCAQHYSCYFESQGHSMTFLHNNVRPITLLFQVRFYNYFKEMITILRRRVADNIWVVFTLWTLSVTWLWHFKRYTFLCPKPIPGTSPGWTGSCSFLFDFLLDLRVYEGQCKFRIRFADTVFGFPFYWSFLFSYSEMYLLDNAKKVKFWTGKYNFMIRERYKLNIFLSETK